ncbi:hypothetical protein C8Q76DRAFT_803963 [Earliella scabrosa]|nr:hypothetical protein C8Q76DRAFT_803963 [Earliella scabrosa]
MSNDSSPPVGSPTDETLSLGSPTDDISSPGSPTDETPSLGSPSVGSPASLPSLPSLDRSPLLQSGTLGESIMGLDGNPDASSSSDFEPLETSELRFPLPPMGTLVRIRQLEDSFMESSASESQSDSQTGQSYSYRRHRSSAEIYDDIFTQLRNCVRSSRALVQLAGALVDNKHEGSFRNPVFEDKIAYRLLDIQTDLGATKKTLSELRRRSLLSYQYPPEYRASRRERAVLRSSIDDARNAAPHDGLLSYLPPALSDGYNPVLGALRLATPSQWNDSTVTLLQDSPGHVTGRADTLVPLNYFVGHGSTLVDGEGTRAGEYSSTTSQSDSGRDVLAVETKGGVDSQLESVQAAGTEEGVDSQLESVQAAGTEEGVDAANSTSNSGDTVGHEVVAVGV